MNKQIMLRILMFSLIVCGLTNLVQAQTQSTAKTSTSQSEMKVWERKNIDTYIELLRANVRQDKSLVMGEVMALNADDAGKFWPIYEEYNAELTKLNNLRRDNIVEYARSYNDMTDSKADELIQRAASYQRQRLDLFGRYYTRVKEAIGAINAARFAQVENQLLLIIDLQLASSLPIVEPK